MVPSYAQPAERSHNYISVFFVVFCFDVSIKFLRKVVTYISQLGKPNKTKSRFLNVRTNRSYEDNVHTTPPEKFENGALFPRLGLLSRQIGHENEDFRKRPSNRRVLKTPAFRFRVNTQHFEKRSFSKNRLYIPPY